MRQPLQAVREQQDPAVTPDIKVFCHRARKYLGAYLAILDGADAVIVGGGMGERAQDIRARICQEMDWCDLSFDCPRNFNASDVQPGEAISIHRMDFAIQLLMIGTDEESWMARETL